MKGVGTFLLCFAFLLSVLSVKANVEPVLLAGWHNFGYFTRLNSTSFLCTANDLVHGTEVWLYDESKNEVSMVKDIDSSATPSGWNPYFTVMDSGVAIFLSRNNEVYRTDGTESGTRKIAGPLSAAHEMFALGNRAIFYEPDTETYHVTDGDVIFGEAWPAGGKQIQKAWVCDDVLYLVDDTGFYSWDGNNKQPIQTPFPPASNMKGICRGNTLYFTCNYQYQTELCYVTTNVTLIDVNNDAESTDPDYLAIGPNNVILFSGRLNSTSFAIFQIDESNIVTVITSDEALPQPLRNTNKFIVTANHLHYRTDASYYVELSSPFNRYHYPQLDMLLGSKGEYYNIQPANPQASDALLVISKTKIYLFSDSELKSLYQIPCSRNLFTTADYFRLNNGTLVFTHWTLEEGEVFRSLDNSYSELITLLDPFPGIQYTSVEALGVIPNTDFMMFAVSSSQYGLELFVKSSNSSTPTLLRDIDGTCEDSLVQSVLDITEVFFAHDSMYFVVRDNQLWVTRGTNESTTLVTTTDGFYITVAQGKACATENYVLVTAYDEVLVVKESGVSTLPVRVVLGCSSTSNLSYLRDGEDIYTFDGNQTKLIHTDLDFYSLFVLGDDMIGFNWRSEWYFELYYLSPSSAFRIPCPDFIVESRFDGFNFNETHVVFTAITGDGQQGEMLGIYIASSNSCTAIQEWTRDNNNDDNIYLVQGDNNLPYFTSGGNSNVKLYYWSEDTGLVVHSQLNSLSLLATVENNIAVYFNGDMEMMATDSDVKLSLFTVSSEYQYSIRVVRSGYQYYWTLGKSIDDNYMEYITLTSTFPCQQLSWCGEVSDARCDLQCFEGFCYSTVACDPLISYCNKSEGFCEMLELPPFDEPQVETPVEPPVEPPQPKQCPYPKPQPEQLFDCDSTRGVWVATNTSFNEPTVVMLSSTVEINGDVFVSENTSFVIDMTPIIRPGGFFDQPNSPAEQDSPQYLLVVNGTITLEKPIIISIRSEQVNDIGTKDFGASTYVVGLVNATEIVINIGEASPVQVEIDTQTRNLCEDVSTEPQYNDEDSRQLLSLVFTVDSTNCNLWWAILIPICSVLIILTIVAGVLITRNRRLRKIVMPYIDAEL